MSDQSDAPVSTEPSDHVVTIPPELPDDDMDLNSWDPFYMNYHLLEPRANQREYHAHAFSLLNMAPEREDEDDLWNLCDELIKEISALHQHETREVRYDGQYRDPFYMIYHLPEPRANQRRSTFGWTWTPSSPSFNWREHILMNSLLRNWMNPVSFCQALQRVCQARREHILLSSLMNSSIYTHSFGEALQRVYQARRSVELTIGQVRMLESYVRFFEDFDSLALPRQRQTREIWYDDWNGNPFGMNVDLPASQTNRRDPFGMNVDLPASQTNWRRPGDRDRYTVIGLISTISCAIYGILFGLTGQMYKEEDGFFFSHHRVMVTISMLSMVYAAFSGVFLCVIHYLATADPTNMYRRRMRFLSGTFVSAACFGPAVMFMAMFVQPLGFKVFAWALLGAALTRVGFYIRG